MSHERKDRKHPRRAAALLALALAACDARDPILSGPSPSTASPIASTSAGFSTIGSTSVETSPTYFASTAAWDAFSAPRNTGYVIPPNSFAIVRVAGAVTLSGNPAWYSQVKCAEITWTECSFPEAGSYGPLMPVTNGAGLYVYAAPSTGGPPPLGNGEWRYLAPSVAAPAVWEHLVQTFDEPAQVWYRPRQILSSSTSSCDNCGDIIKQYAESGGYEISIQLIHLGSSIQTGQDGTSTYGLSAPLDIHGVQWFFAPDTAALPFNARNSSAYTPVDACLGQATCTHVPDSAGRMYALVYMELANGGYGANYGAQQEVMFDATAGAPRIRLRCEGLTGTQVTTNRVTRGNTLTCTAYKDPANAIGDMVITAWWFDSTPRADGNPSSATWAGPMARSGNVRVRGRIGTAPEHDAVVNVDVVARTWPEVRLTQAPNTTWNVLDPTAMKPYPAPGTAIDPSTFGRHELNWPDFTALPVTRITHGPNTGDGILGAALQMPQSRVYIHPALTPTPSGLSPGMPNYQQWHAWYDDQNGKPSGTCRPTQVATFKSNVERHEGVTMASNSHWGKANTAFANAKLQGQMERLFLTILPGETEADFQMRLHVAANQTFDSFIANTYSPLQQQFDTNDTPAVYNIGCNLDFNLADP